MKFLKVLLLFTYGCLLVHNTSACCDPSTNITLRQIGSSYTFVKNLRLDSHNDRKEIYYSFVLSAGTSYQFAYYHKRTYIGYTGNYLVEIRHYDHKAAKKTKSNKIDYTAAKEVVHQFEMGNSKDRGSSHFFCTKTGIYILKVPSAQGMCAGITLAFHRAKHWQISLTAPADQNKTSTPSPMSVALYLKEDEEGYILIKVQDEASEIDWHYKYYARGKSQKTVISEIERDIYGKYGAQVKVQAHYIKK